MCIATVYSNNDVYNVMRIYATTEASTAFPMCIRDVAEPSSKISKDMKPDRTWTIRQSHREY
ncbi:hypothetical protein EWB00_008845 [Schistosoma japonicum]|uniref:Uncharacterized protein n=1 Tax=Schistosoma japonicum TaxID=6182 RepID=A0A4Z2CNE7_SCHJA|nr:hypothetical protein EWB00_008845 [Schistosoma japonicum]